MGRALIDAVTTAPDFVLCAALEVSGSPLLGCPAAPDVGHASVVGITDDLGALAGADVLIDFTRPAGTIAHVHACQQAGIAIVIGTTGLSDAEKAQIENAARRIPVVFAPNMSVGVNVTLRLLEIAARTLADGYDIEILEMHHRHKVDAPSGTALLLAKAAAAGRDVDLAQNSVRTRDGHTGVRPGGSIGFATLRGGSVVGEHSVFLAGTGERIVLSHHAEDRVIFARGAVKAALWGRGKKPGLYSMRDVLGF